MNVCMSRAAGAEKIWDYIWCAHNRSGGTGMLLLGYCYSARGGVWTP